MEFDNDHKIFLKSLLEGDRVMASDIIYNLTVKNHTINDIYENVIRRALYDVGVLWEEGKISVATEHLSSAIVESILNELYSKIISRYRTDKIVVAASVEKEVHQIGIKMVSDVFEMNGWNVHFLGADTPSNDLLKFIDTVNPGIVALSVSIYFHYPELLKIIETIRKKHPLLTIIIGGQGLRHSSGEITKQFDRVYYFPDLYKLEEFIKNFDKYGQKDIDKISR
jgi:methanogenic corrinoid protein MtbC1